MSSLIEVENLNFGYTPQSTILKNITFKVSPGTFLAIAGPNGAGKTTLLNLLCGMLITKSGKIRIDAKAIESYKTEALAKKIAVVRQEFVPVFGFSVIETVMMARTLYLGPSGFESKSDREIVNEALLATNTAQFALRPLKSLSGGERQRVFIARALAQDTDILLLDEPTSFLDLKHQVGIYDLLKLLQLEKGKTIVAITHDINLAAQYCDEILLLRSQVQDTQKPENPNLDTPHYYIGKTEKLLRPELIEEVFGVRIFAGSIGKEKFLIPLGKYAKDSKQLKLM